MVQFRDVDIEEAIFSVYDHIIPTHSFLVLDQRSGLVEKNIFFKAFIIGQSHIFQVSVGELSLSETLVCMGSNVEDHLPILTDKSSKNIEFRYQNSFFTYTSQLTTRTVMPKSLVKFSDYLMRLNNWMSFQFPQGTMYCAALTAIGWHVYESSIQIRTIHTYPSCNSYIETKSNITWNRNALWETKHEF